MIILGIETSCDETGTAVLERKNGRIQILSNIVASSAPIQAKYGGIIPEQAAREQIKSIIPAIEETLRLASLAQGSSVELDAIAVTQGPGLIGSLLVGVETAKVLDTVWGKPLIPVNHLIGHFYANWIETSPPNFPYIGLLVSGGHTDLVLFKNHGKYQYLGGTRDDAAGECFDKCARLLGLPYPGGPEISKLAKKGNPKAFDLPRPMINENNFDFSFSGLKTAVSNLIYRHADTLISSDLSDLTASIEIAIIDVLVEKTIRAAKKYDVSQIMIAGGVASNESLVRKFKAKSSNVKLFVPPPQLCTDNAAMIAAAAFFGKPTKNPLSLQANPNLSLSP